MKNAIDFEKNPVKNAAHEAALENAGDMLFRGSDGALDDSIETGEEFDGDGDLIEESDADRDAIDEPLDIP